MGSVDEPFAGKKFGYERFSGDPGYPSRHIRQQAEDLDIPKPVSEERILNPKTGRYHGPTGTEWCQCADKDCRLYKPTSGEALHKAYKESPAVDAWGIELPGSSARSIPNLQQVPELWKPYVTNPRRQVGGDHYLKHKGMQPFDIIDEYSLNFYAGNALKYLLRYQDKGGILDLEKAKHYIEILIQKERSPDGGDLPAAP